jgi:predicted TPR repeat methyltransferase
MTWDDEAAGWDSNPAVRTYASAAFASLEAAAEEHGFALNGARVCDFGCGTGLLAERLADRCARVDAVDSSGAMLAVLEDKIARRGWTHVNGSVELPTGGEPYDLMVCSSVCAFVEDYDGTVRRLVSRLAPGGTFVQWDWELNPDDEEPYGLTREAIRACLEGAGLEVLRVDTGFEQPFEDEVMRPLMGLGRKPWGEATPVLGGSPPPPE